MTDKLVTLATFGSPVEARIVCNRLEAEGVQAFLAGESSGSTLWHVGTALGGVKLEVAEKDYDRAAKLLEAGQKPVTAGDWEKEPSAGMKPGAVVETYGGDVPHNNEDYDDEDAYDEEYDDEDAYDHLEPRNEDLRRAFTAAVFGLFIFPLQIYSLWLIWRMEADTLSAADTRRFYLTLVLNLPVAIYFMIFVWIAISAWNPNLH